MGQNQEENSTARSPTGSGKNKRLLIAVAALALMIAGICWLMFGSQSSPQNDPGERSSRSAAPVQVSDIERGPIELWRSFGGTLEAQAKFVVASKAGGRIETMSIDVADTVYRGQVVAELDNDEYVQQVAQAQADLAVAKANLSEALSALEISNRELERVNTLNQRGVASASELDAAKADQLAKQARTEVATAQITREEAFLQSARIRLGYTRVRADWDDQDIPRVVARRFADVGQNVSANEPLFEIVNLTPILAIIYVTEQDYSRIEVGKEALLSMDAYPDQTFQGKISRISPVFQETSRQARVEIQIENADLRLKPGMFARAHVLLERIEEAWIVPLDAIATRDGKRGVFLVHEEGNTVEWQPVTTGIRENNRIQITGEFSSGRVVTLGHQLVEDGSPITIPADTSPLIPAEKSE